MLQAQVVARTPIGFARRTGAVGFIPRRRVGHPPNFARSPQQAPWADAVFADRRVTAPSSPPGLGRYLKGSGR
jgi:hypothetical protein